MLYYTNGENRRSCDVPFREPWMHGQCPLMLLLPPRVTGSMQEQSNGYVVQQLSAFPL